MLNIGDFARFAGVSVRMLRHYDSIGLIPPSEVDPFTGYRRYDESLLQRAHRLVALKELGFTLDEVKDLLDGPSDLLRVHLEKRRTELAAEIESSRHRLAEVERRLRLMEGHVMEMNYTEQPLPELEVTQLTASVEAQSEIGRVIGPMFDRLAQAAVAQGVAAAPSVAWYDDGDDGIRFGACVPGAVELDGAEQATLEPADRAVVATYRGPIQRIGEGWQQVGAHLAERGLEAAGRCREVYREVQDDPDGTWEVELQQPVG
jgi:DNA-binding transcriptional MerR regulator